MISTSTLCPVCDGTPDLPDSLEVSEVVTCSECASRLVVDEVDGEHVVLSEAPEVEEDWGQ